MILAAGLGTRLRPLTDATPKPLLPLGGQPLITYHFETLRRTGVREVAINISHLADQIESVLGDGSRFGLSITYFREAAPLGTGGGLLGARAFFEGEPEWLLLNGDSYMSLDAAAMIRFHREGKFALTLALRADQQWSDYGGLWREPDGRITGILKPPASAAAVPHVFAGAWVMTSAIWPVLERGGPTPCLIRNGAMPLLETGARLGGWLYDGPWFDIGTPERLEAARRFVEGHRPNSKDH